MIKMTVIISFLLGFVPAFCLAATLDKTATQWAPYLEWSLSNSSWSGNPYDLVATVTFTHTQSGETRTTQMFHVPNNTWKFRFTATRTGTWTFSTASADPELNGHSGTITVQAHPDPAVRGFITTSGSKFARMKDHPNDLEGYVPNVFMDIRNFGNPEACGWTATDPHFTSNLNAYLDAVANHGCNAAFGLICNGWFANGVAAHSSHNSTDPDPVTFQHLENAIVTAHARGMQLHLWAWGDAARKWTPKGGVNGTADRRLQRYIAARLGPLPGWTMAYGFDLHEWVSESQVQSWRQYLLDHMGWDHLLMARTESNFNANLPVNATDHRIRSNFYSEAVGDFSSGRPVIYERRFAYLRDGVWTMSNTKKAFWQFTLAGGAGSIWGFYPPGCSAYTSQNYPKPEQMRAHATFWKQRFRLDMVRDNGITDGWALRSSGNEHYVFYKEGTSSVQMDLSGMNGNQPAVAVDTLKAYAEINLGNLSASNQTWNAPYASDWAIAVGDFGAAPPPPPPPPPPPQDTTPPSAPSNVHKNSSTQASINLGWNAASDPESGVSDYFVYRNGTKVGSSTTTGFNDTGLTEGTSYSYQVSAVNGVGLEGPKSSAVSLSTAADTQPPMLSSASASGLNSVTVLFSEPVEEASAEAIGSYMLTPATNIQSATLGNDLRTVTLSVATMLESTAYTLSVQNVRDRATTPNTMVPANIGFTTPAPNTGLIGHWPLNETSGTSADDVSDTNNDGTVRNGAIWTSGKLAGALQFDGNNDHVEIPHKATYVVNDGTVAFWFRANAVSSRQGLWTKDSSGYDNGGHLNISIAGGKVEARLQSTSNSNTIQSANIAANTWYHVAFTFGNGGMKLYLDAGTPVTGSYTGGFAGNTEPIALGASTSRSGNQTIYNLEEYFSGLLDDVRFYNRALPASEIAALANTTPVNQAPSVDAGSDAVITLPDGASLNGSASDDGLPNPPGTLSTTWAKVSGPGNVAFGNANALSTSVAFSQSGTYVLRLTADDGALTASDTVTITVNSQPPVNAAPTVDAGADQSVVLPATASLSGSASDDGLPNPPGTLSTTWAKVSGPGKVTFGNANALSTSATFSQAGTYVLSLTANDSALSASDNVAVTVNESPNQAPAAVASANPTTGDAPLGVDFSSAGSSDADGTIVSYAWDFGDGQEGSGTSVAHTYATAGNYTAVLTVTDDDGATDTDTIEITVAQPDTTPPTIVSAASQGSLDQVEVVFSEAVEQATAANASNYAIDNGVIVMAATLQADLKTVTLSVANMLESTAYTLSVQNVRDRAPNPNVMVPANIGFTTPAPNDGLIGHWPLNESSGTSANDVSDTNNDGTVHNGALWTSGKLAGALQFDGSNDHLEIPHHAAYVVNDGTVAFWFKANAVNTTQGLWTKDSSGYDNGGHLNVSIIGGKVVVRLQSTSNSNTIQSANIAANTWYHVAFTFGSGGMKLYLDAANPATGSYTGGFAGNTEPIALGASTSRSGNGTIYNLEQYFRGLLDDVRFYNRALSASEIAALANTTPVNQAPSVDAGSDAAITLPDAASLNGLANDDGLPNPPGILSTTWAKVSGPGNVTFGNASALSTSVTFSQAGTYVLRLTADDGDLTASDDISITVNAEPPPPNQPPVAGAGTDVSATPGSAVNLDGSASNDPDDGPGPLSFAWTQISGPPITLGGANTPAPSFTPAQIGDYVFRLTVSDGADTDTDDVTVFVVDSTPPTIDTTSVVLKGTVDGTGSAIVSLTVNGQPATVNGNQWSREVAIQNDLNTFSIIATDEAGHQTTQQVEVSK